MLSGVPNLAFCVGYTNASWTLRADLVSRYVCRLLNHMARHDIAYGAPVAPPGEVARPLLDLTSGYVQRADRPVPQAGAPRPVDGPPELCARPDRHAPGRRPPRHDLRRPGPAARRVRAHGARVAPVGPAGSITCQGARGGGEGVADAARTGEHACPGRLRDCGDDQVTGRARARVAYDEVADSYADHFRSTRARTAARAGDGSGRPDAAAEPQQRTPQESVPERRGQNTAMGFTGEPVPRPRRSGAITQKKDQRRSSWHSRRSSSRRR